MSNANTTIGIRILDNEYQVSCPESEADELAAAARDLNQRMTRIREAGKVFGVERIAVMAALNAIHDNRRLQRESGTGNEQTPEMVTELTRRVEEAIEAHKGSSTAP
ncbi:MAG: cell division protein ZapA [Gammaproteobacteria bacterium]|nr:cell division protein ZapA [Gammaproteobacteria bacterium]